MISSDYFRVRENGLSPFHTMAAYLGGSAIQTVGDNPVTAYRQLVQQYAKDAAGKMVRPEVAAEEAKKVFRASPLTASLSGLWPRMVGVLFKRIPKFGFLLGYTYVTGKTEPGVAAATFASIFSAFAINPIRMVEKQQRAAIRETGKERSVASIVRESAKQNFLPLFRGTVPLMGHSLASALLGLVGQPKLQKEIQKQVGANTAMGSSAANLIASAVVSPIYVVVTNPLSRLEVIMQTASLSGKRITTMEAVKEIGTDIKQFGAAGMFRGQGVGIGKAILSLTLFHEGRLFLMRQIKERNVRNGWA